ncbi:hypothetical protein [Caulobacter mirabilis]|uniref:hypothetical protein n=1 Tax=Caulobacter mirabilis TaxID=69666 RepID=UPI0012376E77|nr:hypothetical protein [Caulobacter mirabilis]
MPYAAGAIGGFGLLFGAMWGGEIVAWTDEHPGLAGWVQAVGSVVAILVVVWIDRGSVRRQLATQEAERQDRSRAALDAVEDALTSFAATDMALRNSNGDSRVFLQRRSTALIDAERSLGVVRYFLEQPLTSAKAVRWLQVARTELESLVAALDAYDGSVAHWREVHSVTERGGRALNQIIAAEEGLPSLNGGFS